MFAFIHSADDLLILLTPIWRKLKHRHIGCSVGADVHGSIVTGCLVRFTRVQMFLHVLIATTTTTTPAPAVQRFFLERCLERSRLD